MEIMKSYFKNIIILQNNINIPLQDSYPKLKNSLYPVENSLFSTKNSLFSDKK